MRVMCEATSPVATGGWAVLRVTSINDEDAQVAWPTRLHPNESTISFIVDGVRHRGAEQVDSIVETLMLAPGQAVSTGVLVSVSDRGNVLSTSGDVELQVAIYRPGTSEEVLSNIVMVSVTDSSEESEDGLTVLTDLHAAAVDLRDGEVTDTSALTAALEHVDRQDRAWVATALLPAAPMRDDPLLETAKQLADHDGDESHAAADTSALDTFVFDAVPYQYDDTTE